MRQNSRTRYNGNIHLAVTLLPNRTIESGRCRERPSTSPEGKSRLRRGSVPWRLALPPPTNSRLSQNKTYYPGLSRKWFVCCIQFRTGSIVDSPRTELTLMTIQTSGGDSSRNSREMIIVCVLTSVRIHSAATATEVSFVDRMQDIYRSWQRSPGFSGESEQCSLDGSQNKRESFDKVRQNSPSWTSSACQ